MDHPNRSNVGRSKRIHTSALNRLFPTQRLLQIIVVLGATLIMKLLS